jgi:hypothetical protein
VANNVLRSIGQRQHLRILATDTDSLTEKVLGAVFEVSNTLGAGFLEKVYERTLLIELGIRGIQAKTKAP